MVWLVGLWLVGWWWLVGGWLVVGWWFGGWLLVPGWFVGWWFVCLFVTLLVYWLIISLDSNHEI